MHTGSTNRPLRVAIIGTGVLGACVGWNLARGGTHVIFIDAGQPGRGVSDWSFAWVNASNKTITKAYFDLNVAGIAEHRALAEAAGSASGSASGQAGESNGRSNSGSTASPDA